MCYDWGPNYHVEKLLSFPLVPLELAGKSRFVSYALIFVGASGYTINSHIKKNEKCSKVNKNKSKN